MSDHPEHYREIAKALRDGLPYGDIEYKTLNLSIILSHLYLISKDTDQMYDSTKDLLRTLMEEHDKETLDAWNEDDAKAEYEAKKEALVKEAEELKKKIRLGCGCQPYQPCHTCGKYEEGTRCLPKETAKRHNK